MTILHVIELLVINGVKYRPYTPKSESEFEQLVKDHLCEIFGADSICFDIKPDLRSKAGIGSKPDGIVIQLDEPSVYVVEFELSKHLIHDHIVAQLSRFNKALKSSDVRLNIANAIYSEISVDPFKKILVESKVNGDVFKFLTDLLSSKPKVIVIIDEILSELREALEDLPFESKIIEFKTFEREGVGLAVHAHLFEPLKVEAEKVERKVEFEKPEHYKSWEARLNWVEEGTRNLIKELILAIEEKFPEAQHMPRYRWYYFYKGSSRTLNSLFAVLMLTKKSIKVRIKADPNTFKDERNWTKVMKGWFFPRKMQEREFAINDRQQISYALELVRQSYDISQ
ncbi:MAG: hypothetical protein N3A69_08910 [Leptospiraceae bacterium]|nr:hypothetical protein [Leptospiraceae bacterium]